METRIYGVFDKDNCLIDIGLTERGAKISATRNGYTKIGYRIGYNAFFVAEKINGIWTNILNRTI